MSARSQATFTLRPARSALVRHLYATLIAAMAITPQNVHPQSGTNTDTDVTQIQALVARAFSDTSPSSRPSATIILDLQRTLGGTPDPEQHDRPDEQPQLYATTPAPLRGELRLFPAAIQEPVPESASDGLLQQRGGPLPPPPARRSTERYRMNLMPHAPPTHRLYCA